MVTNQVFHVLACFFLKELASALKSALSGHLETVILGLLKTPAQYDASELKASMKVRTCGTQSQPAESAVNICELQLSEDKWVIFGFVEFSFGTIFFFE